ncbi:MAG: hypothetical protein IT361_07145 [Gemmatimonadaceae bacterium]|nr:hypothetical protein [Gemmatimonadaceae bacterium]
MSLSTLRARIASVVTPPPAVHETVATGVPELDAVLPGGGLPCGRLTEVAGRSGSGATTLARALVAQAIADNRWVAYIDAARTLAPADWAPLATTGRLWVVRPPTDDHGAWCADLLLRSHAFGLVVLDDAARIPHRIAIRLTRLAQDTNAALVVVHHHDAGQQLVGSALRLHMQRTTAPPADAEGSRGSAWRRLGTRLGRAASGQTPTHEATAVHPTTSRRTFLCTVSKGGKDGPKAVEVYCAFDVARRLRPDPPIPDRRGVATRNRLGERAAPDAPGIRRATPAPDGVGGTALPRKRRCAEPATSREHFLLEDPQRAGEWAGASRRTDGRPGQRPTRPKAGRG